MERIFVLQEKKDKIDKKLKKLKAQRKALKKAINQEIEARS